MYIMDEVQTGVGLTGKMWAHEHFVKPDIIAFGKKTQVCGILVSERVDEVKDNVFHVSGRINSTFGGNLTDMIRFARVLEVIHEENLLFILKNCLHKFICHPDRVIRILKLNRVVSTAGHIKPRIITCFY
ncbi:Aminotransferase class-III [Candidatus Kryptonium thompsonii]|nr:Aminotransferase class-III [Candidatus Kryptonium thompsoni]